MYHPFNNTLPILSGERYLCLIISSDKMLFHNVLLIKNKALDFFYRQEPEPLTTFYFFGFKTKASPTPPPSTKWDYLLSIPSTYFCEVCNWSLHPIYKYLPRSWILPEKISYLSVSVSEALFRRRHIFFDNLIFLFLSSACFLLFSYYLRTPFISFPRIVSRVRYLGAFVSSLCRQDRCSHF